MALPGRGMIIGGVVSTVRTVCTHEDEFPAASVAVQVRVIVIVPPQPGTLTSVKLTVGIEQLSTAVALPVAAGLVLAGHSRTTSAGHVIAGAVASTTVTVFHPHVHAIVSRGGWTEAGQWVGVASVDPHAAVLLFRHKVLSLLRDKELIDHDRIALLLSWKHSGFSVHNSVVVQPEDSSAMERLVRYVMRSPVSLDRLGFDHETAEVRFEPKAGADDGADAEQVERLEGDELVARVIVQIPDPKRHLIRSYGQYANASRAKRTRDAARGAISGAASGIAGSALPATEPVVSEPDSAERKAARKRWANLIRHIYEVDPLVCPRCGGAMKIISFITERQTIRAILESVRCSATPSPAGSLHPPPTTRPAGEGAG